MAVTISLNKQEMIMTHNDNAIENLPNGLSKPAIGTLSGAGYLRLEHFGLAQ